MFLAGLLIVALGVFMFLKPDVCAELIQPTFFVDKLGMSSRSAYQVLGLVGGIFGVLLMFGIFGR